jgi:serine/threonine kinase 32
MSEEVVRFYVAEIAMAIDYLHSKKIVHRYVPLVEQEG